MWKHLRKQFWPFWRLRQKLGNDKRVLPKSYWNIVSYYVFFFTKWTKRTRNGEIVSLFGRVDSVTPILHESQIEIIDFLKIGP
jgi:hypothetical protein